MHGNAPVKRGVEVRAPEGQLARPRLVSRHRQRGRAGRSRPGEPWVGLGRPSLPRPLSLPCPWCRGTYQARRLLPSVLAGTTGVPVFFSCIFFSFLNTVLILYFLYLQIVGCAGLHLFLFACSLRFIAWPKHLAVFAMLIPVS